MQVVIVVSISRLIITDEVGTVDNVIPIPMDKDEEVAARFSAAPLKIQKKKIAGRSSSFSTEPLTVHRCLVMN